jgi:tetratricopeptide (TPR) repeat protein
MSPPDVRALLEGALADHQSGRRAKAEQGYRRVLNHEPKNLDALRLLGILVYQAGRIGKGLGLMRRAAKAGAADPAIHMDLARALAEQGNIEEAVECFRTAADLNPDNPAIWGNLALAFLQRGDPGEATVCFRKALVLDGSNADLHLGLGNALRIEGKLDAAADTVRRAVALRPDFAEAHMNLGNILLELNEMEPAIASHRQAASLKPGLALAHHNLGIAYRAAGRLEEAVSSFRQSSTRDPAGFDSLFSLGVALKDLEHFDDALECLGRARRLRPGDAPCARVTGLLLRDMNRPREALDHLAAAIDLEPDHPDAHAGLAGALETLNRRDEASKAARRALALESKHIPAAIVLARIERREGQPEAARNRLRRLNDAGVALGAPAFTELGQAHDRLGEFDEAFDAFTRANRHMSDKVGDAAKAWRANYLRHIDRYRQWYDPSRAARWEAPTHPADKVTPVFFVGFPRSGTTLFEQILDSHPSLATSGEEPLLTSVQQALPEIVGRDDTYPEVLDGLKTDEAARLGEWYMGEAKRRLDIDLVSQRLVDKLPLNIVHLGLARRIFPSTPVIVALRDPRDVILSCFMQNFRVNQAMAHFLSIEGTARLYAAVMELWLHYRSDAGLNAIEYRYEDLVADTEGVARRVFEFLDEPWDESVLQYQSRATERFVSTPSYADVSTPIYDRSIGRWRNYARQLAPAQPILAPFVREFGYSEE